MVSTYRRSPTAGPYRRVTPEMRREVMRLAARGLTYKQILARVDTSVSRVTSVLRPLGGGDDEVAGVFPTLEQVTPATFEAPDPEDTGPATSAALLRTALRIGFRASAGPFRSLARLGVEPRAYQLVPLLMALRQDTVRMLISDDVGIGKTVEAGLA